MVGQYLVLLSGQANYAACLIIDKEGVGGGEIRGLDFHNFRIGDREDFQQEIGGFKCGLLCLD